MKQMITVAGGVFFAVAIMSLILGGATFARIVQFQNELESRGQFDKVLRQWTGFEELDKQKLQGMQDAMDTSLVIAGMSGSIGVGLAIAGKGKPAQN